MYEDNYGKEAIQIELI